jgi:hypothetical protein
MHPIVNFSTAPISEYLALPADHPANKNPAKTARQKTPTTARQIAKAC